MDLKLFVDKLFSEGSKHGFKDMEIYYVSSENFSSMVFEGQVDKYDVSNEIGLSFRGIINGKMGYAYTERFEEEDIGFLLINAKQNADVTENDEEAFIYDGGEKTVCDAEFESIDEGRKLSDVLSLEKVAKSYDERIKSVNYCMLDTTKVVKKIINTKGLDVEDASNIAIAYVSAVAKENDSVKNGRSYDVVSDYNSLKFNEIGETAAKNALAYFGAKSIPSNKYNVVIKREAAADLLATFSSIFSGEEAAKGLSLLKGKEGVMVASDKVTIVDDPMTSLSPMKIKFDDEGVKTYKKDVIKEGVLNTLLYDLKTAKKVGVKPTGNGFKSSYKSTVSASPTNLCLLPGEKSLEDFITGMDFCVIITELQGLHSGANTVSGDFSLGAMGFLVKDGKIERPIEQITIAGNFYDLLKNVKEVMSDFKVSISGGSGICGSPSVFVGEISIAGEEK